MAGTTAGWSLPYSEIGDVVNLNGDIQALAEATDNSLTSLNDDIGTIYGNISTLTGEIEERSQDAVAAAFAAGSQTNITITYNDGTNAFDASVPYPVSASATSLGYVYGSTTANNTALGYQAMSNLVTGTNSSGFGHNAQPSSASASNEITLGNSSVAVLRAQVTSITSLSDGRDKRFAEPIPVGLAFVLGLNPVKYEWNMRDGGKVGVPDIGFIAQDLAKLEDDYNAHDYLQLTYRENPDKLEASYGRLVPILVKAIQELAERLADVESDLFFMQKG